MDSMRHLSTSLPTASSHRPEAIAGLLADFRAAALSVTNLYKTASAAQAKDRAAGYQDALDDLLAFLDKENLGLMDGEGWKVRQWATARLDSEDNAPRQGVMSGNNMTDDDEEESSPKDEDRDDDRASSPEQQRKAVHAPSSSRLLQPNEDARDNRRVVSEPPVAPPEVTTPPILSGDFTFQSPIAYPSSNHDRDAPGSNSGMELDNTITTATSTSGTDAFRMTPRHAARSNRHTSRRNPEARPPQSTLSFNLGVGAGNKRKAPYHDFFDISGFNHDASDRKDGSGSGRSGAGGKRGRHV